MLIVLRGRVDLVRRLWRVVVVFAVARLALGVAALLLFERDAIAWGPELTTVVAAAAVVYVAVAMALRRAGAGHPGPRL